MNLSQENNRKIFKGDQLSQLISQLDFLDDLNSIDFSDIDLTNIDQILTEGPAAKYLPRPNESYKDDLPPKNKSGDLIYSVDGKEFTVPSVYVPLVEFAFHRFEVTRVSSPYPTVMFSN